MDYRIIEAYAAVIRSSRMIEAASEQGELFNEDELQKEVELCKSRIDAGKRGYTQTVAMYESLFGMPSVINPSGGEIALRLAEKDFFDADLRKLLFNPQQGLFAKKPKVTDYQRFCRSAQMLVMYYSEKLSRLEQQLVALRESAQSETETVRAGLECAKANVNEDDSRWNEYPLSHNNSNEIYIGDFEVPVEFDAVNNLCQLGIVEREYDSVWLQLPFTYNVYSPFSVLVSYTGDTREGETKLGNLIRSFMYQIIHSMPPYSYEFIYLDPTHGGATLRELLTELVGVVDGNAYQLHEKLYPNSVYRMLTLASNKEQVREQLKTLENRIAVINTICGGQPVAQFNAPQFDENGSIIEDNVGVIPQVFVFFENVHGVLDQSMTETLQKLADCAGSAGISLIATSVRENGQSLTAEELSLLKEDQLRDDLDHIEIMPGGCSLYIDAAAMGENADKNLFFNFNPRLDDICQEDFLKLVSKSFKPALTKETDYIKRLDLDSIWGKSNGDNEIRIPVGVNHRDHLVYIELGGPDGAHALLAGETGCGKSSYLHVIINGVIAHYKPTDVQLWLSDYKSAEFRRYMKNTPPHVTYVGVARSLEYTFSFIDRIHEEYERRLAAFGTCTSIAEYRKTYGQDSMPRILIVVDEFHAMSNHIKDFPEYKMKLASLLREMRAMGMTFLLADQTCGIGLQGLSADAMLQLTCRMAMRTTDAEYNAVFNITNAKDVIQTQDKFEVTLQRLVTQVDSLGKTSTRIYYEHCKTLHIDVDLRNKIAQRSIEMYGPAKDPMLVEEADRVAVDWEQIAREEVKLPTQRGIPIYMGTPVTLSKFFSFRLMANYGQNVVNVVPREEVLSSIFAIQLENIRRQGDYEIYIIADENDSQFCICEEWLNEQAKSDSHIHIATYIGDICDIILQLRKTMIKRRRMRNYKRIAVFWMGLFDIAREMEHLPNVRPDSKQKVSVPTDDSLLDGANSLSAQFEALFGEGLDSFESTDDNETECEEEEMGYNANADISELMEEGPKRSIHNFCYYTSVNIALQTKCAPLIGTKASFTHKIALGIGKDESLDYFGASRLSVDAEGKPLDDKTAVYYNGRAGAQFMPFIIKMEAENSEPQRL